MKTAAASILSFIFLLYCEQICALTCDKRGVEVFCGPEIYYVKRTKEGGAEQTGTLYGVRLGYEKVKRYKFYYAVDGLFSQGILKGKANENTIKSELTNSSIETRFGYTFQAKYWPCFSLTPFVGVGYIWEYSQFLHPSPLKVHFDNRYPYIPFGFLSSFFISDRWQIGLKFTARFTWDGKQKVTHDPEHHSLVQCYEDHMQYRVELPIAYYYCWCGQSLGVRLTPFYEYRRYGTYVNFPFDFIDTKLNFYGANLELLYRF